MFNRAKFNYYRELRHVSLDELSDHMGINPATLSRKMNGSSDFYRHEILAIRELMQLSAKEVEEIFFDN